MQFKYIKAKDWDGEDLQGVWEFTYKIDGVRAFFTDRGVFSRNGKPLYNLDKLHKYTRGDFEVYLGSFKHTIQAVRTQHEVEEISQNHLYSLSPLDRRLELGVMDSPTSEYINNAMFDAVQKGFEGLVLRQGNTWLKVKPVKTYDVPVTDVIEGRGRNKGRMGALMTPMGKVGTGFTDSEREWWANANMLSCHNIAPHNFIIEVACMELTEDGKFRHPRFVRIREDKCS